MNERLIEHLKNTSKSTLDLIYNMENYLLIVNFSGDIGIVSDSIIDTTQISKDAIKDMKYYDILKKEDVNSSLDFFDLLLLDQKDKEIEVALEINKTERIPTMLISSSLLKNFFENEDYVLLLLADIREHKKNQSRLMHTNKMVALGEMATNIAHEINNPLAIIDGQLRMLERNMNKTPPDIEKTKDMTLKIRKNFERISKIIVSLRHISRNENHAPFEETTLNEIFISIQDLSENRLKSNNIDFKVEGLLEDMPISCRPTEILQVLCNLINNSIDSIKEQKNKWIKVEILSENGYTINVIDSGSGIPLSEQIRLFEPFFTTKGVGEGTGLGLSISEGLIKSHKGSLMYNPSLNNTCFTIKLPLNPDEEESNTGE